MQAVEEKQTPKQVRCLTKIARCLRSPWFMIVCMVAISASMFFILMPSYPMQNWDEGIHSQVTRELVETGDWWTLHYQGEFYFRKPPLKMWLTAPLVQLFGDKVWVYRFWSSFAGVASVALLAYFVYRKEKDLLAAWLAGLIFVSGQFIFYHAFRTGETDALLVFLLVVGFFAYWNARANHSWFLLMGASFGLAIMTKSLAGAIGPIVVVFDILLRRQWSVFRVRYLWYGVAVFFVVALPWHVSMISMYGKQFWDEYIGFHVVDRTLVQLYADMPWHWYATIFWQRLFPLSYFMIGGLLIPLWRFITRKQQDISLAVLWLVVTLLLFTAVKTKFEWYILPAYPAAAWILARYFSELIRLYTKPLFYGTFALSLFLVFAKTPQAIPPGARVYWLSLQAYIPVAVQPLISNSYVWSAIFVLLLAILYYALRKRKKIYIPILFSLLILHSLAFAFGRDAHMIATEQRSSEFQEIARVIRLEGTEKVITYQTDFYDKPAGYFEVYATTRDIQNIKHSSDELRIALTGKTVVITSEDAPLDSMKFFAHIDQYYLYGSSD